MNNKAAPFDCRRAEYKDMNMLIDICRHSFPGTVRWQSSYTVAKAWWSSAIGSDAVEVWVLSDKEQIDAFLVLVTDEAEWARQKRLRQVSLWYSLSALRHSAVWRHCLAMTINAITGFKNVSHVHSEQNHIGQRVHNRIWLELLAVRPNRRGSGLARQLMMCCETRAAQLGRQSVVLRVAHDNVAAKMLYEKQDFILFRSNKQNDLYLKDIKTPIS
jgi:ribosomal protein S18 acetylase RimI-like enzyme